MQSVYSVWSQSPSWSYHCPWYISKPSVDDYL